MAQAFTGIVRMHAQLRDDAAELFRALDRRSNADPRRAFQQLFLHVHAHLGDDITAGYRLLLRSPSTPVRLVAKRLLDDQEKFARLFEFFALQWNDASGETLRSDAFRDELETIVSELMKRIRAEERLLAMLASVA